MIDPSVLADIVNPDSEVRENGLDALGDDRSSEAVALLVRALAGDPDASVRGTAACNLEHAGTPEARAALLRAIDTDASPHVRDEAFRSLRGDLHPDVLRTLLAEIERPRRGRRARQEVAQQLGDHDDDRAVEALGHLLKDQDVFVRDEAAASLLRLNRPAARPYWEHALEDHSADVREAAVRALAGLARAR